MSDYARKYQAAIAELEATEMWPSNYAPPAHRIQRWLGWKVRPPHYGQVWVVAASYAVWFGPIWGLMMWFAAWQANGMSVLAAVGWAGFAGVSFGIVMTVSTAWGRRKWKLSAWEDL